MYLHACQVIVTVNVPLVEFTYLVFTRMPGDIDCGRFAAYIVTTDSQSTWRSRFTHATGMKVSTAYTLAVCVCVCVCRYRPDWYTYVRHRIGLLVITTVTTASAKQVRTTARKENLVGWVACWSGPSARTHMLFSKAV